MTCETTNDDGSACLRAATTSLPWGRRAVWVCGPHVRETAREIDRLERTAPADYPAGDYPHNEGSDRP